MNIIIGDDISFSGTSLDVILPLYLVHNGVFFPCEHWTDFASVLNMWAHDLVECWQRNAEKFSMYFMDGPYRLDIAKNDEEALVLCVDSHGDVVKETISCKYVDLLEMVRKANKDLRKILRRDGLYQGKYEPIYKQTIITENTLGTVF